MSLTATEGLTREDVSYLRRASDVYAINIEGQNFLRCVKRGDPRDAFSEDKRVDIPVDGNGAHGYFTRAWEFPWHTLRAGHRVSLYWFPDAWTNRYLTEVGLHADALYVDVTRGKQRPVRYLVDVGICEDNTARMCRTSGQVSTAFG